MQLRGVTCCQAPEGGVLDRSHNVNDPVVTEAPLTVGPRRFSGFSGLSHLVSAAGGTV